MSESGTADLSYATGQHSVDIPSINESERRIAEKAPAAIQTLLERNATDLYEMLGLTNYVKKV